MDPKLAKRLLLLVNDFEVFPLLEMYAKDRIAHLQDQLERTNTIEEVKRIQGSLAELRAIINLPDNVRRDAKNGN